MIREMCYGKRKIYDIEKEGTFNKGILSSSIRGK